MKPIKQIPVKESLTELGELYKNSSDFLKPRIGMFMLLAKEPVITKSQLARKLNVAYNSISKWHELYSIGGIDKLLEMKRGKYRTADRGIGFSAEVYEAIEKRHKAEPFQSYVELHAWVKNKYFPAIKYSTLIKYIELHFGAALKIGKLLHLPVKESVPQLEVMLTHCLPRIKPRIKMLIAIKQHEKISKANLASKLNVSYGSIVKWVNIYKHDGVDKLLKYNLELIITPDVLSYIEKKFQQNKFTNFSEIHREIGKKYLPGIQYYTLHRYIHRHFPGELYSAKALHMPIKETVKELEDMYAKSSSHTKQRIKMLQSLKADPGLTKMELAKLSGVAVGSIHRWYKLYKQGGLSCLLDIKLRGRKQLLLPARVHMLIEKKIKQSPEMNITELHVWLISAHSNKMSYNKLYRYVRKYFTEYSKASFKNQIHTYAK